MSAAVGVKNGSVYLPARVYDTYFPGILAVVVLIEAGTLRILPVREMAAGGCLLKIRNAAGDRVASAPDVFRVHGLEAWQASGLQARWSSRHGALLIDLPAKATAN